MGSIIVRRRNKHYTQELKLEAIQAYQNGEGSYVTVSKKYGLRSKTQLENWVKWYNGHKEIRKPSGFRTEIYMTKGRKTSQQERVEIVAHCIEHGRNYAKTIEEYGVSYQQVYGWVRKYEAKGVEGLTDGRGRTKPIEEMNEVEKLRAENRILQARNYDLEIENAFIKKLKELEGVGR